MSEVKKWDINQYEGEWATMGEDTRGDYVLSSDYDQLKAENERLASMLNQVVAEGILMADERDALRAQLDEARELLADAVEWNWLDEDAPSRESIDAWLESNKPSAKA